VHLGGSQARSDTLPAMRTRTATSWRLALLLPTAVVALAACGADPKSSPRVASLADRSEAPDTTAAGGTDGTEAPKDPQEEALAFAKCMREHGIDMPDPQVAKGADGGTSGGLAIAVSGEVEPGKMQKAQDACGHLLQSAAGGFKPPDPEQQAKLQEQMLAFAKCMREHGIDFPDPKFDQGAVTIGGADLDPSKPEFQKAQKACGDMLPGGGPATQIGGSGDGPSTQTVGGDG
jgi:hypothetical protein